jgi:hypothetical protein
MSSIVTVTVAHLPNVLHHDMLSSASTAELLSVIRAQIVQLFARARTDFQGLEVVKWESSVLQGGKLVLCAMPKKLHFFQLKDMSS